MKTNNNAPKTISPQTKSMRPENKDNLDSRKEEEQTVKGNDISHNKKETHGEPKKRK